MAKRASKAATPEGPTAAVPEQARITRLDEVIGHENAIRTLRTAMAGGRLHHAWIFHGPGGVGKFTAAYAFATAVLDPTTSPGLSGELAPEQGSQVQALCTAGTHPDLHIITKELAAISREDSVRKAKQSNISKHVLAEFLIEPAVKTRVLTGASMMGKVFIVDEAELLDAIGQNHLLKILEEPPIGTLIILVTSNEDRLLPTIRSRCQRLAFQPLTDAEMDRWFKSRKSDLEAKRAAWVRRFAGGSPGLALLAIEADLYQWHEATEPIFVALDRGGYPADAATILAKLIAERAEADVKVNPDASKDAANKAWARRMLSFLAEHYRTALRERAGSRQWEGPDDRAAAKAMAAIEAIQAAEGHMATNVNPTLLLENLVAQLAIEPTVV